MSFINLENSVELLLGKKTYASARDISRVRLIEPTGKAFDKNAIARADRADSSFLSIICDAFYYIEMDFFIDECDG